jgi:hypothetical protein
MLHLSSGLKSKASKKPAEAGDKLRLTFDPEDGGDIFLFELQGNTEAQVTGL